MGILYTGDCEIDRTQTFNLTVDKYGLHSLTRTFQGRSDKLTAFLATWPRGKADATFKQFKLTGSSATGEGAFTTVVLSFAGLLSGELPAPERAGGWSSQTASIKNLTSEAVVEIEYRAPTATYRYVTDKLPTKLKYERKLISEGISWEIVNIRGDRLTQMHECKEIGRIGGRVSYTETVPGKFNYARDIFTSGFEFHQVGEFWEVTESCEGRIIEPARNDLPRFLMPGNYSQAVGS